MKRSAESKQALAEEIVLRQALEQPERFSLIQASLSPEQFQPGPGRKLAEAIWRGYAAGNVPRPENLLQVMDEDAVKYLSRLTLDDGQGPEQEQALDDCIRIILLARLNEEYESHRLQADEMLRRGDLDYVQELMNAQRILTKISDLTKSQG